MCFSTRNGSSVFATCCNRLVKWCQHTELLAELAFDTFANVRHYVLVSEIQNQFFVAGVASMNRLRSK